MADFTRSQQTSLSTVHNTPTLKKQLFQQLKMFFLEQLSKASPASHIFTNISKNAKQPQNDHLCMIKSFYAFFLH